MATEEIKSSQHDSNRSADETLETLSKPENITTTKERLINELKEVALTVGYLAASLCILETYKSLILLQQGINDFQRNYVFALAEAILLGKIVAITQKLPLLKACSRRSLATAVLYQSFVMTLITDVGGRLEDRLLPRSAELVSQSGDPLVLALTHQFAAMLIFVILFTVRGVDEAMGPGKLWKLIFSPAVEKR